MKGKLYYIVISVVTVIICFTGCTESASTESKADKRALEDTDSKSTVQTEVTTTLTPLETFTRFTAFAEKSDEAQTEKAQLVEKKASTTSAQTDRSEWFEKNKLFDMELSEEVFSDEETTWYDFSWYDEEETQATTTSVQTEATVVTTTSVFLIVE